MASEGFSLTKIIADSKKVLLSPKEYFSSMPTEGGIGEPILKALVYGVVAGIFSLLWSILNISGFTGGIFGGAVGIMAFLGSVIWAIIGVFIGAVIVLIISAIAKGNNDFEANMRVAASVMVIMPINAFLGFTAAISGNFGAFITLLVNLYAVYILYFGITQAMKAEISTSKVVHYILAGILVLFFIVGMGTRRAVEKYTGMNNEKAEKLVKKYQQAAEEAAEKMTEELNAYQLEMENGDVVEDAGKSDVKDALKQLGEDNEFMILSKGTKFVQVAVTADGYLLEYRDETGYFRSVDTDLSLSDVEDVFYDFLKEKDWKDKMEWEKIE